jgi:hypothetical protein
MHRSFAAMMMSVSTTRPIDMGATLKSFPVKLKTVREYASETLKA